MKRTTLPGTEIEPLLKLNKGDPFVDARVSAITAAIEELYRVRGYERVAVKPAIEVLPEAGDGPRFRPVDVRFTIVEGTQTTVDDVRIEGARGILEEALRSGLGLVPHPRRSVMRTIRACSRRPDRVSHVVSAISERCACSAELYDARGTCSSWRRAPTNGMTNVMGDARVSSRPASTTRCWSTGWRRRRGRTRPSSRPR